MVIMMTDNQQQQMNVNNKRPVGEVLLLTGGLIVLGLGAIIGLRAVVPEAFDGIRGLPL